MPLPNPIPALEPEVFRLDNGLTVILAPDRTVPIVAVDVSYGVGAKDEAAGRTGLAHLLEHLLFQGTAHFDRDFFKALQGVGGQVNGGTDHDRTRYWEVVPANYLGRALWLESDRMGWFLPALSAERFENQREVVKNERRQSYENRPYGTVGEELARLLYPQGHPYSWPVIGWMADIDALSVDDARTFFSRHYGPSNASLAVVGDFEPAVARELVQRYFGAIPPGPPLPRLTRFAPSLADTRRLVLRDRVALPLVVLAWPTTSLFAADAAALDVFAEVFGAGKTGRLFASLVYERQIAQNVYAVHSGHELAGALFVYALPRPGTTAEALQLALDEELAKALAVGISAEDLERAQATRITAEVKALERRGGFGGRADNLNAYQHYLGRPDAQRWDLQRYLDLTPEVVNATARRYLGERGERPRVELTVEPVPALRAATTGIANELERATLPGPDNDAPALRLPLPERATLANGLRLLLVRTPGIPAVEVSLLSGGGTATDPVDRPGLADLTLTMIAEGSLRADSSVRGSLELAGDLKRLGARLGSRIGDDYAALRLSTLRQSLEPSLALLAEIVSRPAFLDAELERQRLDRLTSLLELRENAEVIAMRTVYRALYPGHPYGHPRLGDEAANRAVTIPELRAHWAAHYQPRKTTLVVAGDLSLAAAEVLVNDAFGAWSGATGAATGGTPAPAVPLPPAHGPTRLYVVDRPGAAQSILAVAQHGIARTSPDFVVSRLANQVLGGFFSSRLNMNLRERHGFTYGARTSFTYTRVAGPFLAWAPVDTGVTRDALVEILAELADAAGRRPFTSEEVDFARGNLAASFGMAFETTGQIASHFGDLALYNLPDATFHQFVPQLLGLDTGVVNAFAQRLIEPARLAVVVVGDAARVLPTLADLGLGEPVFCDLEGRLPQQP